ncbi:hypothetical protein PR048_000073 [Dryococelus australis]|uniref:Uncharacterized protein n=1 Tax=Dryococelus australis TaxID=614101 RepID=A0ABQ9IDS4_9NEOP|nr:hypothetical protein PR048_000073 [Dryococelus australis]
MEQSGNARAGGRDTPEETRRVTAPSGTIPKLENPGVPRRESNPMNPLSDWPCEALKTGLVSDWPLHVTECSLLAWPAAKSSYQGDDWRTASLCIYVTILDASRIYLSIPGRVTPVFPHVGIVPDNAAGRRVFSEISRFPRTLSGEICAALNIEVLRCDEGEERGWGNGRSPIKPRRPAASSGTIPTCGNTGVTPPGIEAGSPVSEASSLTTTPLRPPHKMSGEADLRFPADSPPATATNEQLDMCSAAVISTNYDLNQYDGLRIIYQQGSCGGLVVRLLASHQGETGSFPAGIAPGFSHSVGFLWDLSFPSPLHSGAAPYSSRFTPIGSQDIDVKSSPNLFTSLTHLIKAVSEFALSTYLCIPDPGSDVSPPPSLIGVRCIASGMWQFSQAFTSSLAYPGQYSDKASPAKQARTSPILSQGERRRESAALRADGPVIDCTALRLMDVLYCCCSWTLHGSVANIQTEKHTRPPKCSIYRLYLSIRAPCAVRRGLDPSLPHAGGMIDSRPDWRHSPSPLLPEESTTWEDEQDFSDIPFCATRVRRWTSAEEKHDIGGCETVADECVVQRGWTRGRGTQQVGFKAFNWDQCGGGEIEKLFKDPPFGYYLIKELSNRRNEGASSGTIRQNPE